MCVDWIELQGWEVKKEEEEEDDDDDDDGEKKLTRKRRNNNDKCGQQRSSFSFASLFLQINDL